MTAAAFLQTLQALPTDVEILEGFVAENTLDVYRGTDNLGYINIEDGSYVELEEDENGRLLPASSQELASHGPAEEARAAEDQEISNVSRIPRDTLIETVRGLPPEAELREPIDETGKLEVYQGETYIGHVSLEDGRFVAYDVIADSEGRNRVGEEEWGEES